MILALSLFTAVQAPPTVSVSLERFSKREMMQLRGAELLEQVVVRITQEGFAAVAPETEADVRLELVARRQTMLLRAHAGTESRDMEVSLGGDIAALHLEIAHHGVELVRAVLDATRLVDSPAPPAEPEAPPLVAPTPSAQQLWAFSVFGGAVLRDGVSAPVARAQVSRTLGSGVALAVGSELSGFEVGADQARDLGADVAVVVGLIQRRSLGIFAGPVVGVRWLLAPSDRRFTSGQPAQPYLGARLGTQWALTARSAGVLSIEGFRSLASTEFFRGDRLAESVPAFGATLTVGLRLGGRP